MADSQSTGVPQTAFAPMTGAQNQQAGVGLLFHSLEDSVVVKEIVAGGSAHLDGRIAVGDVLVKVNGEQVHGISLAELRHRVVGDWGSPVTLTFDRRGQVMEATLARGVGKAVVTGAGALGTTTGMTALPYNQNVASSNFGTLPVGLPTSAVSSTFGPNTSAPLAFALSSAPMSGRDIPVPPPTVQDSSPAKRIPVTETLSAAAPANTVAHERISRQQQRIGDLEAQNDRLEAMLTTSRRDFLAEKEECAKLRLQLSERDSELAQLSSARGFGGAQLASLQEVMPSLLHRVELLAKDNAALREALHAATAALQEAHTGVTRIKSTAQVITEAAPGGGKESFTRRSAPEGLGALESRDVQTGPPRQLDRQGSTVIPGMPQDSKSMTVRNMRASGYFMA